MIPLNNHMVYGSVIFLLSHIQCKFLAIVSPHLSVFYMLPRQTAKDKNNLLLASMKIR